MFTGKCQSCWVWARTPRKAVGGPPQSESVTPLGGVPSVTALSVVLPGTNSPSLLMEEFSTRSVTEVPGV